MRKSDQQALTTRQLADALGVSESSIKRWVDEGEIRASKTAGGHRRIPLPAALAFVRRHNVVPANPSALNLLAIPEFGNVDLDAQTQFLNALASDDLNRSRAILQGRFLAGAEISQLADQLIRPALVRFGETWNASPDGILKEHRAVQLCLQLADELRGWIAPVPSDAFNAITSGFPDDPFLLPPLLASLTLREARLNALNIGPHTPFSTLAVAIRRYDAKLCAISASTRFSSRSNADWLALREVAATEGCAIILGGRCLSSIPAANMDGFHTASSLVELAAFAKAMVHSAKPPAAKPPRRK